MKLKKDLQVNMSWDNNKGYYNGLVSNFPLSNGLKADFNLRVACVENVYRNADDYDMLRIDVEDLKVFTHTNDYIQFKGGQERELINSIQTRVTWG